MERKIEICFGGKEICSELGNDKKMGRKGNWFSSVKKALSPDSKEKKDQKSKKKWFGKQQHNFDSTSLENAGGLSPPPVRAPLPPPPQPEEIRTIEATNEQNKHIHSVPVATEPAPPPPPVQTTEEVVRLVKVDNKFVGKSREEVAAIKIQTALRGYMARRALRALRGLVRLKSLMEGPTVKRQATHTLHCMQTLARVQAQIHSRRVRMSEENQALHRQLLQKHAQEIEKLRMGDEWDDSLQSKEQIEANLLNKYEAAMRRERAMAYAFTHQKAWKNSARNTNSMFMSSGNPAWGWSWLERWMAAHPWDSRNMTDKESNNDHSSVKSAGRSLVGGEISKSYARYQLNSDKLSPIESEKTKQTMSPHSPSTPSKPVSSTVARKLKSASPRSSVVGLDEDSRSMVSLQSDRYRRHSIAGSSVRDDESLGSSSAVPSYMVPTESARAKSTLQSPLGADKNGTPENEKTTTPGSGGGPVKKRLSYPPSPARPRRQTGPRKLENNNFVVENGGVKVNGQG